MLGAVWPALGYIAATVWMAVLIHEAGHYLAGLAVGLPARAMRIRLRPAPPHVALRDGEQWLSPEDRAYVPAFVQYRESAPAAWIFIAGGFVAETVAMVGLALATQAVAGLPAIVLLTSTAILLLYLAGDVIGSARSGEPTGDASALWRLSKAGTLTLIAVLLGARALALMMVW
ncbi:hypothetical protein EDD31_2917 [Bogoriella caseilytica]|uniref:Peptidase M50B-like protein n=2 Tax=Bogoriella caseilytica TaxID=56055 RepID=A0A3N2BGW3_9MICO|nr:hypothetical protein EDD31_2917 [Bogoriella caseilytica]